MKTFNIFKEDLKKSLSPLKDFGKSFAGQAKEFAKSKEAKDLKTNVMNMFIGKGEELLNKGSAKLKDMKKKIK
tara:strand:+ start:300 stop:518 length:219 start_codon:yes stop_codon:yes gene_type:complete